MSPANGTWFANATVPVNGTASGASDDVFSLFDEGDVVNGTFNGTEIDASGAIAIEKGPFTRIRYSSTFDYADGTYIEDEEAMWSSTRGEWRVLSPSGLTLKDPPALGATSDRVLFWRGVSPANITGCWVRFTYATEAATWLEFGVATGGNGSDLTVLLNSSKGASETAFSYNLSSRCAGGRTVFLFFRLGLENASYAYGAIDNFEVALSFVGSENPGSWSYVNDFAEPLDVGWDEQTTPRQWSVTATGPAPSLGSLTHLAPSGSFRTYSNVSFRFASATDLRDAALGFSFGCAAGGHMTVSIAPGPGTAGTLVVDSKFDSSPFQANISSLVGNRDFVLHLWADSFSGSICFMDNLSVVVLLAADPPSYERGEYETPVVNLGMTVNLTRLSYSLEAPALGGHQLEARVRTDGVNWTAWVSQANNSSLPVPSGDAIQLRISMWGYDNFSLPKLTALHFSFFGFVRVEVSTDAGQTWNSLNFRDGGSANLIEWGGSVILAPGMNDVVIRSWDTSGLSATATQRLGWDVFPPEAPAAPLDEGFASNRTTLTWSWVAPTELGFGIVAYGVRLGTAAGASNVLEQLMEPAAEAFSYAGGVNGETYFIAVAAIDGAGQSGPWSNSSDGIIVDLTPPVASAPGNESMWVNTSLIRWTWPEAFDAASGPGLYEIRVGSVQGAADVVADTAVLGLSFDYTAAEHARSYYASLRAIDRAGNVGSWNRSVTAVRGDMDPPTEPGRPGGPPLYSNLSTLTWGWLAADDTMSGVSAYEVAVQVWPDPSGISGVVVSTQPTYTLQDPAHAWTVVVAVRALDAAGNRGEWSEAAEPIAVDRVAPAAPAFVGVPPRWVADSRLNWSWGAVQDDFAGTAGYCLRVGASEWGEEAVREHIVLGTTYSIDGASEGPSYYLSLCAVDRAGNRSPMVAAPPASVDLTGPTLPVLQLAPPSLSNASALRWEWSVSADLGVGIDGYDVCVGEARGGCEVVEWLHVNLTYFVFDAAASGTRYYFAVRGKDLLGWTSAAMFTREPVLVDRDPPSVIAFKEVPATSRDSQINISWDRAFDQGGSGLAGYEISVSNETLARYETLFGPATASAVELQDQGAFVLRIRAFDWAGNRAPWSSLAHTTIDWTPPTRPGTPSVQQTPNGYEIRWTPSDDERSGISGYRVALGTSADRHDVVDAQFVELPALIVQLDGSLAHYYVIEAVDGAGNVATIHGQLPGFPEARAPSTAPDVTIGLVVAFAAVIGALAVLRVLRRQRQSPP